MWGFVDGQYIINPSYEQRRQSRLDLVVAGSRDGIVMVEAGAKEVTEEETITALDEAHKAIKQICDSIDALAKDAGKREAAEARNARSATSSTARSKRRCFVPLREAMRIKGKIENYDRVDQVLDDLIASIPEGEVQRKSEAKAIFKELQEKVLRDEILEHNVRLDGRKFDEIRQITIETGVLPRTHGSVVFTRGETQALVTATLGTADDQQKIESVDGETWKRFMLHYNFPPFSVGEVRLPARPRPP